MRQVIIFFVVLILVLPSAAQDFLRVGVGADLKKSSFVQTISIDLNRTEKVDEDRGKYFLFNRPGTYLLPGTDINLGKGVTSSENNVSIQLIAGKFFSGKMHSSGDNLSKFRWNKTIELNPVYTADKNYVEKLYYGQLKLMLHLVNQRFSGSDEATSFIKRVFSFSIGGYTNMGYHDSKSLNDGNLYSTAGLITEFKSRWRKKKEKPEDDFILKISGKAFRIIEEVPGITSRDYAGLFKCSLDKHICRNFYGGIGYKYNSDTPGYAEVQTMEFSLKIKY